MAHVLGSSGNSTHIGRIVGMPLVPAWWKRRGGGGVAKGPRLAPLRLMVRVAAEEGLVGSRLEPASEEFCVRVAVAAALA
eukprot:scaffold49387_cov72-Phaeocystis_antarctica.AAC.9